MCSEIHSIEQKLCVRDLSKSQLTSCKISTTKHGCANQISDHLSRSCKISWDFGRSFKMCKSAPILEVSWDILQDVMQKGYGNAQTRDLSSKDPQTETPHAHPTCSCLPPPSRPQSRLVCHSVTASHKLPLTPFALSLSCSPHSLKALLSQFQRHPPARPPAHPWVSEPIRILPESLQTMDRGQQMRKVRVGVTDPALTPARGGTSGLRRRGVDGV
jgi:hypothetical protein